jgi:flagellar basal body P-ring formation protein FlgA
MWNLMRVILLLATACPAWADNQWQDLEAVYVGAIEFARRQTAEQPGTVTITTTDIDPRLRLSACHTPLEYFVPVGGRLWGSSSLGARCAAPSAWTIYIPLSVKVVTNVVFAAHPLIPGQKLTEADILLKNDDITQFAHGAIGDPKLALGKTVAASVPAGYPLRADMLRAPFVVLQGQSVKIVAQGRGFQVNSEGKAQTNAAEGQLVGVRLTSGKIIKGTAKEGGVVEVPF